MGVINYEIKMDTLPDLGNYPLYCTKCKHSLSPLCFESMDFCVYHTFLSAPLKRMGYILWDGCGRHPEWVEREE